MDIKRYKLTDIMEIHRKKWYFGFFKSLLIFFLFEMLAIFVFYGVTIARDRTFLVHWDASIQSYAWMSKLTNAWKNFEMPLWDFSSYSGTTFAGELQTAPFYPLNILFAWLSGNNYTQYKLDLLIVFHFGMASYFMFLFCKEHGFGNAPSIIAGLIYAYIGSFAIRAPEQPNIFCGMAYLPLVLFFYKKSCSEKAVFHLNIWNYLAGMALALSILAGHMQPYMHIVIALFVYFLFINHGEKRQIKISNFLSLLFVGIISVMISLIQLVPLFEYLSNAYRWVGLDEPVLGSSLPWEAYGIGTASISFRQIISGIFLQDTKITSEGGSFYITFAGFILALIGIAFSGKKIKIFAIITILLSVLVSLGNTSPIGMLFYFIPLFNIIREPTRILFLYTFAASVLAACGYERSISFIDNLFKKNIKAGNISLLTTMINFLFVILLVTIWIYPYAGHISHPFGNYSPGKYYTRNKIITYLENESLEDQGVYRIINRNDNLVSPNIGNVYDVKSVLGHRATMYAPYFDYLNRDWNLNSGNYDKLGAKYILSNIVLDGFKEILSEDGIYLYERPNQLSVFYVKNGDDLSPINLSYVGWKQNSVLLKLDNSGNRTGELVFAQPVYPGWNVYVDGKKAILDTTDIFMSVKLSGAEQEIEFKYQPKFIYYGIITVILVIVCFILSLKCVRQKGHQLKTN